MSKFLDDFEKFNVNAPLFEEIKNTPNYVKCLQKVSSRKTKLEELGGNMETRQVLPPKLNDSRSFTIPCTTRNFSFDNVLYDLDASINVMSFSMF